MKLTMGECLWKSTTSLRLKALPPPYSYSCRGEAGWGLPGWQAGSGGPLTAEIWMALLFLCQYLMCWGGEGDQVRQPIYCASQCCSKADSWMSWQQREPLFCLCVTKWNMSTHRENQSGNLSCQVIWIKLLFFCCEKFNSTLYNQSTTSKWRITIIYLHPALF